MKATRQQTMLAGGISMFVLTLLSQPTWSAEAMPPAKQKGFGDQTSDYIKDYLSDPRRTGSLSGSILGGALTAHPAGPILGSLMGFFIGKQTMFEQDKTRTQQQTTAATQRNRFAQSGTELSSTALSFSDHQALTFSALSPVIPATSTTPQPPMTGAKGLAREQIALLCSDLRAADPRMRGMCYYYQAN